MLCVVHQLSQPTIFAIAATESGMATRLKPPIDADADLLPVIEAASREDDGAASLKHLAAGFPIYYSNDDTPSAR